MSGTVAFPLVVPLNALLSAVLPARILMRNPVVCFIAHGVM